MKKYMVCLSLVGIIWISESSYAVNEPPKSEPDAASRTRVMQSYGKLPISFVENRGQMDSTVRYYVSGPTGTMFFTKYAIVMEFVKREKPPEPQPQMQDTTMPPIPSSRFGKENPTLSTSTTPVKETRLVLKKSFIGVNPKCEVVGEQELPGRVNILRGNDPSKWKQNIATYRQIRYKNLYPGIDAIYRGSEGKLEYEIHIAAQKKANQIKFKFEGADKIELTNTGDLKITTKLAAFTEKKTNAYQEKNGKKIEVATKFVLGKDKIVRIDIGKYEKKLPLVIE